MTKASAIRRLKEIYHNFSDSLFHTINFQLKAPDSIKFYQLEKTISTSKLLLEKDDNKKLLEDLQKEFKIIEALPMVVHPMTIIYGIAHFEVMLTEMAKLLLLYFDKSLSSKDKTINYEDLLKFDKIESLFEFLAEEEANSFAFKSIRQKVNYFEKKFNLKFSHIKQKGVRKNWNCIELEELIEIHSTRNIIVHNNSTINKFYLNDNPNTNFTLKQKRIIDDKYSIHTLFVLFRVSSSFFSVIKKKIES
jgi:hypothetical protein